MDGYTVVVCAAAGCGPGDPGTVAERLVEQVGAAVVASSHGLMVSTGCLVGPTVCAARPAAPVVVVQPCDDERRPTAPALRVGPLRTSVDVDRFVAWLRAGRLRPDLLPAHLLAWQRRAAAAPSN